MRTKLKNINRTSSKAIVAIALMLGISLISCTTNSAESKEKVEKSTITANKMGTINLNKADFLTKVANFEQTPNEWKYLGDKPAIIDFYADWCGPCKAMAPILEEVASEYGNDIYVYKINVDKEPELAALFAVRNIPSLLFIPQDGQIQMSAGAIPKTELKEAIGEILLGKK